MALSQQDLVKTAREVDFTGSNIIEDLDYTSQRILKILLQQLCICPKWLLWAPGMSSSLSFFSQTGSKMSGRREGFPGRGGKTAVKQIP